MNTMAAEYHAACVRVCRSLEPGVLGHAQADQGTNMRMTPVLASFSFAALWMSQYKPYYSFIPCTFTSIGGS